MTSFASWSQVQGIETVFLMSSQVWNFLSKFPPSIVHLKQHFFYEFSSLELFVKVSIKNTPQTMFAQA